MYVHGFITFYKYITSTFPIFSTWSLFPMSHGVCLCVCTKNAHNKINKKNYTKTLANQPVDVHLPPPFNHFEAKTLNIPLFGTDTQGAFWGTKTGNRQVFRVPRRWDLACLEDWLIGWLVGCWSPPGWLWKKVGPDFLSVFFIWELS